MPRGNDVAICVFQLCRFLSIALRIPTAHDSRVNRARTLARAMIGKVRDFSQVKLDSKMNAGFLLRWLVTVSSTFQDFFFFFFFFFC